MSYRQGLDVDRSITSIVLLLIARSECVDLSRSAASNTGSNSLVTYSCLLSLSSRACVSFSGYLYIYIYIYHVILVICSHKSISYIQRKRKRKRNSKRERERDRERVTGVRIDCLASGAWVRWSSGIAVR